MRAAGIGVYLLVMSVAATLTYLLWHAVGETINPLHGVQPRYFVPVLPLLLLPLRNRVSLTSGRLVRWLVPTVAVTVVLIGMGGTWQAMIQRHYLH
jgi:uncharacterized membrane protein